MATSKETVEFITLQLLGVGEIRTRNMMGEYLLYVDDLLIGQINNNELFIKVTVYGNSVLTEELKASPYPGAKLAFKISKDKIDDTIWLVNFVAKSRQELAKQ